MKDYSKAVSWVRDDEKRKVKFYIHTKCDERDVSNILGNMYFQREDVYTDYEAHILRMTEQTVAYRIRNEVYIIPAIVKAVVNNGDKKMSLWFDYPVEMDEKGLVEY